jgi:hypothetical protein
LVLDFARDRTNAPNSEPILIELCSKLKTPPTIHFCARNVKRVWVQEGAMNNIRNWASAAVVASLILLAPIIAFVVVVTVEMLGDLMARAGATVIWPAVAGAMAWVLLRKFGGQPDTSGLTSEGA